MGGMKLFKKPFEAFKAKIERELQRAVENDADDENTDDLEESFLEKEGKDAISAAASAITLKAADPVAVFTTWLDLCANWHIISNVYIGLYMNLKALKTSKSYKTFLAIWTSFAALHWQFTFIYKDFLNIWNQYRKIEWLPKYEMWFTRVMHVWVSLQQWCGVVDLYGLAPRLVSHGKEPSRPLTTCALCKTFWLPGTSPSSSPPLPRCLTSLTSS